MQVLSYLWSNALMITTYLQSWLLSSPLGGAIFLHRLLPTSPLFSLPQIFGCTAFVQDQSPFLSKLSPCALKVVFIGYSRTLKGYRVYFPTPIVMWLLSISPSVRTLPSSPLPCFPLLLLLHLLYQASLPLWSFLILFLLIPLLFHSPLILFLYPWFHLSPLLWIHISCPPPPLWARYP